MKPVSTTQSLISIIIPAYNAEKFIEKAIDSVLVQSYRNFELIVVNDGSSDKTEALVKRYQDTRLRLITQTNGGLSQARNTGIRNASGTYLAFLDADDYWLPEKLEKQIELMTLNDGIGFCSTQTRVETPDGEFLNDWKCPIIEISTLHTIFIQNAAIAGSGSSVLVKKDLQMQAGFFDETLKSLEDIDMWMRYATISEYCCLPESLTVITKRADSMSKNMVTMRENAIKVLKKNRQLLDESSQKGFWRSCYAGMLCDYAKWEYRCGLILTPIFHLFCALTYAPLQKGRLCVSLLLAIISRKTI